MKNVKNIFCMCASFYLSIKLRKTQFFRDTLRRSIDKSTNKTFTHFEDSNQRIIKVYEKACPIRRHKVGASVPYCSSKLNES